MCGTTLRVSFLVFACTHLLAGNHTFRRIEGLFHMRNLDLRADCTLDKTYDGAGSFSNLGYSIKRILKVNKIYIIMPYKKQLCVSLYVSLFLSQLKSKFCVLKEKIH